MIEHYFKFKKLTDTKSKFALAKYSTPEYKKIKVSELYFMDMRIKKEYPKRQLDFILFSSEGLISSGFIPAFKTLKYLFGVIRGTNDVLIIKTKSSSIEIFVSLGGKHLYPTILSLLCEDELKPDMQIIREEAKKFSINF